MLCLWTCTHLLLPFAFVSRAWNLMYAVLAGLLLWSDLLHGQFVLRFAVCCLCCACAPVLALFYVVAEWSGVGGRFHDFAVHRRADGRGAGPLPARPA